MKALRIIFVFFLLVLLAGCTKDNVWNKPGASSDDLSKTRYACIQQSRQGPGSASFFVESNSHSRSYGGSDHVFVFNNPQIFDACMNAAGWNLQAQGAPLSSQPRQQNVVETAMAPQNTSDPMRALCTDPAYQEYFAQSPCPADEDHASQGTEPSTSIVPEKSSLEAATAAYHALRNDAARTLRKSTSPKDRNFTQYLDHVARPAALKNRLDLYYGKVTLDDYIRRRNEIDDALYVERKKIYK